ncbi:MAG TPA: hypothetical protein VIP46_02790 [Pyrinomonadaceae bacterium]
MILTVYIPRAGSYAAQVIAAGSAIVGSPSGNGDTIRIDFEGNLYGAVNGSFDDCLARAAGRHVERYPTCARLTVNPNDVIAVGSYDSTRSYLLVDEPGLLEAYRAAAGATRG